MIKHYLLILTLSVSTLAISPSHAKAETKEVTIFCGGNNYLSSSSSSFDFCANQFGSFSPKGHTFKWHDYSVKFPVDGSNKLRWTTGSSSGTINLKLLISEHKQKITGSLQQANLLYSCSVSQAAFPGESYKHTVRVAVKHFINENITEKIVCFNDDCRSTNLSVQSFYGKPVLPGVACSYF